MRFAVVQTWRVRNYDRRCKKDVYTDWYETIEDAYQVFEEWVRDAENHELDETDKWLVSVAVTNENNKVDVMWVDRREVRKKGDKIIL